MPLCVTKADGLFLEQKLLCWRTSVWNFMTEYCVIHSSVSHVCVLWFKSVRTNIVVTYVKPFKKSLLECLIVVTFPVAVHSSGFTIHFSHQNDYHWVQLKALSHQLFFHYLHYHWFHIMCGSWCRLMKLLFEVYFSLSC